MSTEFIIADELGTHLADVNRAVAFRHARLEPSLARGESVILDFTRVRHSNDSFMNGLLTKLFEVHGEQLLERLGFHGCAPLIRVLVDGAIALGLKKSEERATDSDPAALRNLFAKLKAEGRYDAEYTGDQT